MTARSLARALRPRHLLRTAVAAAVLSAAVVGTAAPAASADQSTYYVDCGSGGGDGSAGAPWGSLGDVAGHGAFGPGDRILLRRGTTCHGRVVAAGWGSAAAPIVLGAYGDGAAPTVSGDGTPGGTGAIELDDVGYWTVQDLHVTNSDGDRNTNTQRSGVLFHSTTGTRLPGLVAQRLTVDGVTSSPSGGSRAWGGITADTDPSGAGFDGLLIANSTVTDVGRSGIATFNLAWPASSDQGTRITGNTVTRARGDSIVTWGVRNARIDHNRSVDGARLAPCSVEQCGRMGSGSTASAGIWPINAVGVRIDHNEVSGESAAGGDGEGIDVDVYTQQVVVEQNSVHDNAGGGILFCGAGSTTARGNVLVNNGRAAITFSCGWVGDSPSTGVTITNNRIVNPASARYVVRSAAPANASGIRFRNNAVQCSGACIYSWPTPPIAAGSSRR